MPATSPRPDHPNATVRKLEPWISMLARVGYAAKGVVYLVVGTLAARAAAGVGGQTTDMRGALDVIGDGPFGTIALLATATGLIGYAAWRLVGAATDAERRGSDPSSIAVRLGHALRGLAYGALGVQTLYFLTIREELDVNRAQAWTARLLGMPAGRWMVIAVGAGIVGYACYQLYLASSDKPRRHLDLASAGPTTARWIVRLGRFGIAARAVVFGMIGVLLVRAGWRFNPSGAGGIEQSLDALASGPTGAIVLGTVAAGLAAYGLYEIATARYRYIRAA